MKKARYCQHLNHACQECLTGMFVFAWLSLLPLSQGQEIIETLLVESSFEAGADPDWDSILLGGGTLRFDDGDLILAGEGVNAAVLQRDAFSDMALRTQVRLGNAGGIFLNLRAHVNPYGGYLASLGADGAVELLVAKPNGSTVTLARAPLGFDPVKTDVSVYFRVIGLDLALWAWPAGSERPLAPLLEAADGQRTYVGGQVALNSLNGEVHYRDVALFSVLKIPVITEVAYWPKEIRFEVTWPSTPGRVYDFEYSPDQATWFQAPFYAPGAADAETTTVIVSANLLPDLLPSGQMRIRAQPGNEGVPITALRPQSKLERIALTWESVPDRAYRVEYSDDLVTWKAYEGIFARGGLNRLTTVVLPVANERAPTPLSKRYYRMVSLPEL